MYPALLVARLLSASVLVAPAVEPCLHNPPSADMDVRCAQLAAAARLRVRHEHGTYQSVQAAMGPTGQGALVGLGIGLGIGIIAALVVAPGCEENSGRCSVTFIVGGGALGAGIGAAVGAVTGRD